ncbi:23S rRNA (uracil(1939)-C(5))-methyltransferase RlmD [Sphingobacteriales bacterium UPWRP_1]|nr:23S rRNA (uracil(1939)-C(5))-methyltransferase RlmD [Sphingobacteriales bacterium TSM_CSM]PSJ75354.1 23S rRNA (uracil(1939)-C(5))-methyltransferase RlmD [Sphingobacteriales bacterium UPWRP_1]
MKKGSLIENLPVTQIAAEGKGIARHEGMVVFIDDAVPGDVADVRIVEKRSDYATGKLLQLKQPAPERTAPFCSHFGTCGGCKWQYLQYPQQAAYKQQITEEALKRVGKLHIEQINPIITPQLTQYYRNKMEFTFSARRWLLQHEAESEQKHLDRRALGFHVKGMYDRVVNLTHCYLQENPSNQIRNEVYQYCTENNLPFYDIKTRSGYLRNLLIRTSTLGQLMVVFAFAFDKPEWHNPLLEFTLKRFPQITALQYAINGKRNDMWYDLDIVTYAGNNHITEQLGHCRYKIGAKSFFQTNSHQALKLYGIIEEMAQLNGSQTLYDLYTGTGSIGLFLARNCKQVVGIEEVDAAIEDARYNAQLNGIENAFFYTGDVRKILTPDFARLHGQPDVLITDPPRAGMHPDVVKEILHLAPPRVVYVSCNPVTQARDLQLMAHQYHIRRIQPIDMFPHTYHIENVALLELMR